MPGKLVGIAFALSLLPIAQAAGSSGLQECAAIENATNRLACFEALAAKEKAAIADEFAAPRAVPEDQRSAAQEPATPEEARAAIGAEKLTQAPTSSKEDETSQDEPQKKTAKQQAREGIWFSVARAEKDGERRQIFYMSDGQVWREIEPSQMYFPRGRAFKVLINQGKLGDYRLRVNGKGRRTRVVRLR